MRLLLAVAVSFLIAGSAWAAGELKLTVIAETNNTLTLGWAPQPGFGYLFSVNGQIVSRTNDPARATVKFGKVAGASYEVAVLQKGQTGIYPPVVPPMDNQVPASVASDCSQDVTAALQTWVNGRPNNSTLVFPPGSCYRVEGGLALGGRTGLTLVGTGSTLRATGVGDGHRPNLRSENGSDLTVRGFRLEGGYTTPGNHDPTVQWSHGIEVLGTQTVLVEDVTVVNVGGDCVYLGLGSQRSRDATVRRLTCTGLGRNGVSFVAADRSRVEQSTVTNAGYVSFDVEPNSGPGFGVDGAVITGNTIGAYQINAFTIVGSAPVANVSFSNNQVTSPLGARIQVTGLPRRTNITVSGNTATNTLNYPQAIRLDNVDGATVTNNSLPTTGVELRCSSVTGLTFSGNTPNTQAGC